MADQAVKQFDSHEYEYMYLTRLVLQMTQNGAPIGPTFRIHFPKHKNPKICSNTRLNILKIISMPNCLMITNHGHVHMNW